MRICRRAHTKQYIGGHKAKRNFQFQGFRLVPYKPAREFHDWGSDCPARAVNPAHHLRRLCAGQLALPPELDAKPWLALRDGDQSHASAHSVLRNTEPYHCPGERHAPLADEPHTSQLRAVHRFCLGSVREWQDVGPRWFWDLRRTPC